MKNAKRKLATTLTTISMVFAGYAFAGDAEMHMEFYLKDKVTTEHSKVSDVTSLIRAESIKSPMITSTIEQQSSFADYVAVKPAPVRVFQQRIYSVRSGDTLIKISRKTGIDVLEIARLNQIKFKDLNHIKVGQKLKLI